MVQRYGFSADFTADCYCNIEESKDGTYIKREDVIEALKKLRIIIKHSKECGCDKCVQTWGHNWAIDLAIKSIEEA